MTTRWTCLAVLALVVASVPARAQTGDAAAGRALWSGNSSMCRNCHGADGEGGFGPDLAGRALTTEQFARAVRQPWGIMPAFPDQQVSDRDLGNLVAFLDSLPRVAQPGPWRVPLSAGMPSGQQLAVAQGCAQCHGAELPVMRQALGGIAPDFSWFTRLVYAHTAEMPEVDAMLGVSALMRMGNYDRLRIPEPVLEQVWRYLSVDLGFRARVQARMAPETAGAGGATQALTVRNAGLPNKGMTAEDITVTLALPAGAAVASATGSGYQGTQKDDKGVEVATFRIARLAPGDAETLTITLSGNGSMVETGTVSWATPPVKKGASGDSVNIAFPPRPTSSP